jgi:hypothetical protein
MSERDMIFSRGDAGGGFALTPLGAAIVEALPDRSKVSKVKKQFKNGRCPSSNIFDVEAIDAFYGGSVKGYTWGVK